MQVLQFFLATILSSPAVFLFAPFTLLRIRLKATDRDRRQISQLFN
jgi:hypothetical protein